MIRATVEGPVSTSDGKTGPQVLYRPHELINQSTGVLHEYNRGSLTYRKIREMRKDPTISMVRQLIIAPAMLAPWSFEKQKNAPDGSREFIEKQLAELRTFMVRTTMYGCIDYGWQSFEKIFDANDDGQIVLSTLKPLLPDHTEVLVKVKTGAFAGLREWKVWGGFWTRIRPQHCFYHAFDVEGTYWYGQSYMANAEMPYDLWGVANDANSRYDEKIAGSHWVIHYPMGVSLVNGAEKNNEEIAQEVLAALQSSGGIAVPKKIEEFISELDRETPNAWEIELISDSGATQTNFLERMAYLDKLKVRAFGFPERSILEGKYGTKAEAETHADFAVTNILLRAEDLVNTINKTLVDQLLNLNYGPEAIGTIRLRSGSIGSDNKDFLRSLYTKFIEDPKGFVAEFAKVDRQKLRDVLAIPTDPEKEEETEIFENALEKLEKKGDDDNALFDENGSGDGIRPGEYREVGRPQQFWGPPGDRTTNNMGDLSSRREDRRQTEGQSVRDSTRDNLDNDR